MCKVMMISGIKKENVAKVWKFVEAISKPMSKINNDGIGYAAITAEGKLFGERWLINSTAFNKTTNLDDTVVESLGELVTPPYKSTYNQYDYNSFGEIDKDNIVAITLHTRYATSPRGMMNTHPFVDEGISLIHNGVIRNDKDFDLKSTCDSEAILRAYLKEDVKSNPANFKAAAKLLKGYYACGLLTNTEQGPILDLFKSVGARLHAVAVEELGAYVISTDDSDIKDTAKELGFTAGAVHTILSEKFVRINAITGVRMELVVFEAFSGYETYNQNPTQSSTSHTNTKTITGNNIITTTKSKVYDFPKKTKDGTNISQDMMDYFKAGARKISTLSEREMQEEIMELERLGARM